MGERIRVFHLIKNLQRGGAETLLTESLRFADHEHFTYAFGYLLAQPSSLADRLRKQGASVACFGATGNVSVLLSAWKIARALRAWNADLLHCHLPLVGVVGRLGARIARVPVIYTEHNLWERYHPASRFLNRVTWRMQDGAVAVSDEVAASIRSGTDAPVPVTIIRNGVDVQKFHRQAVTASRLRRELRIGNDAPVIGTVAIFKAQKRLDAWLRAAHSIRLARPDVRFLIVGDGPLRREVHALAGQLDLHASIRFAGLCDDVRPYLAEMDVYMMSSVFEGLPVAVLEAMAMECAVVSTAVGGIPEVITHEVNGLLVPVTTPEALVPAALRLIAAPAERADYGRAARARVVADFSMERMVGDLEDIYRQTLTRRLPPRRTFQ